MIATNFKQIFEDETTMEGDDGDDDLSPANRTAELIGDGSQPYALPTLNVRHDRFKRIDAATLVKLIDGHFKETIASFTIIDARYPYEYHGGHIVNSLNIHTGSELTNFFIDNTNKSIPPSQEANQQPNQKTRRDIIIFHCEFSSERGPRLMRLLREKDRQINKYPQLLYPELYLLEGGYREFYRKFKEYCIPQAYKPMKSRSHRDELRTYRRRRKAMNPRRKENRTPDISFEG